MRQDKDRSGFTIAEVLVGTGIFFIALMAWVQTATNLSTASRRGLSDFNVAAEQRALTGMLSAVNRSSIEQALCAVPHPWASVDPGGTCKFRNDDTSMQDKWSAGSFARVQAWKTLSNVVLDWPSASKPQNNSVVPKLSSAYFSQKVVPAMQAAGCLNCHASNKKYPAPAAPIMDNLDARSMSFGSPNIYQRDFTNFTHMTEPFSYTTVDPATGGQVTRTDTPLATRAILTSRFGGRLMSERFQMANLLANSTDITHYVNFTSDVIKTEVATYRQVSRFKDNAKCSDPNASGTFCLSGELYQGFSCNNTCLKWNPPPVCSCGKGCRYVCGPATCSVSRAVYSCLSTANYTTQNIDVDTATYNPPPGPFPPTSLETIADSGCAGIPGAPCGGQLCNGGGGQTACIQAGSCQRLCSVPTWSKGYSCGKNCFVPPKLNGCATASFQFVCQTAIPPTFFNQNVIKFTIDSTVFDTTLKTYKNMTTMGIVQ